MEITVIKQAVYTKFLAGLPRALRPILRIWLTSFRLVVTWLTERTYVRVYRLYGWGRGDYLKGGGVFQACLWKSTFCISDNHKMVNWQLSKQDSHWPVSHDHIAGSCVNSSRWCDLFGSCPLTSCFTRSRPMFLVEKNVTCQSRKSDFGWHRFRFALCLMRKRVAKSEAILALLDTFQCCISNGKPE